MKGQTQTHRYAVLDHIPCPIERFHDRTGCKIQTPKP